MPEYYTKSNGGRRMLSAEELLELMRVEMPFHLPERIKPHIIEALKRYRNQGIQQASEVCCETLTDGFRISNVPAVLALKEKV